MMNGNIVAFNNSTHQKVQALLPWFVVDTLTGEDLALVEEHLQECTQCQSELAWQRKLQAIPPSSVAHPDVERAFAKLRPRLDMAQRRSGRRSLKEFLENLWHGNSQWMRWTLATQFAVILGLAFMLVTPYGNIAAYRALGVAKNTGGNMVVVFKPETSEQDLRSILRESGARIVDGPTAMDAYLLSVPKERLATAIQELRKDRAIVLAESLDSGGAR